MPDNMGKVYEPIHLGSFGQLMASGEGETVFSNVLDLGWSTKLQWMVYMEYVGGSKGSKLVIKKDMMWEIRDGGGFGKG